MRGDIEGGFFEGALDGCGCVIKLALAFLIGALLAELLFQPWFWALALVAVIVWALHHFGAS